MISKHAEKEFVKINEILKTLGLDEIEVENKAERALVASAYDQISISNMLQIMSAITAVAMSLYISILTVQNGELPIYPLIGFFFIVVVPLFISIYFIAHQRSAKAIELIVMYRASSPVRPEI